MFLSLRNCISILYKKKVNSTTVTGQQSNDDDGIVSLAKSSFFSILFVMKKKREGGWWKINIDHQSVCCPSTTTFIFLCVLRTFPFCVIGKIEWWNISRSSPLLLLSSIKTHRQPDIQIKRRSQIDNGQLYSAWRGQIELTPVQQQQQQQHARPFPLSLYAYIAWTVYILQLRQLSTIFSGNPKSCLFICLVPLLRVQQHQKIKREERPPRELLLFYTLVIDI